MLIITVSIYYDEDCAGNGRGRVFIGDVGQNGWEEIDLLYSGDNYGWSAWEANTCYKPLYCDEHGKISARQFRIVTPPSAAVAEHAYMCA